MRLTDTTEILTQLVMICADGSGLWYMIQTGYQNLRRNVAASADEYSGCIQRMSFGSRKREITINNNSQNKYSF